jgi:hypothetical protein
MDFNMNYAEIAFSDVAKKFQEKAGSRASYARMEKQDVTDSLTENEIEFISDRDSFYLSTVGENGFPYIQHRGGPKGFLKVLDKDRLGFIDFQGNKQFISTGNISTNPKVALLLMNYAAKVRLKIFAEAELVELKDRPELFSQLNLSDYKFKPERMMIFHVRAFNWNCPQHITPRYTLDEIEEAFESQKQHVRGLEEEIKLLKGKLAKC